VTFVYVTHDQSEALTMSDRVAVFTTARSADRRRRPACTRRRPTVSSPARRRRHAAARHRALSEAERCGIVLTDGRVLTGMNVNGAPVGAAVQAGIRPEARAARQARPSAANVLQAQVADVIYFGDHLRLLCRIGEGQAAAT